MSTRNTYFFMNIEVMELENHNFWGKPSKNGGRYYWIITTDKLVQATTLEMCKLNSKKVYQAFKFWKTFKTCIGDHWCSFCEPGPRSFTMIVIWIAQFSIESLLINIISGTDEIMIILKIMMLTATNCFTDNYWSFEWDDLQVGTTFDVVTGTSLLPVSSILFTLYSINSFLGSF